MSSPTGIETANVFEKRRLVRVISLVSGAHFFSHFYLFLLPPLFPLLKDVYGVTFIELGLALTVFNFTSAVAQAPVGFLVDRFGAKRLLIGGLVLQSTSMGLIGFFPTYMALLVLMICSGIGNTVYHPADYTILNLSVDKRYMGRAFSVHTFSGYVGQAIGPLAVIFLITIVSWADALIFMGLLGLVGAVVIAVNMSCLQDRAASETLSDAAPKVSDGLRILVSLPVILGVLFFAGISISGQGITTFGYSALHVLSNASIEVIGLIISAYLFASPIGVLVGGWIADKTEKHDRNIAGFFLVAAGCVFVVAAIPMNIFGVAVMLGVAGLFSGMVAPSRDMLIRSVTPSRHIGKVFGFVSTGFNLGGIFAPVLFGYLLDKEEPNLVFFATGVVLILTIVTVLGAGTTSRKKAIH